MNSTRVKVGEAFLQHEAVQASLNGLWRSATDGCPHLHKREDIDRCDAREMRPCVYQTSDGPCEIFEEILEEWRRELEICPECGEVRPGDERVKAGMKCSVCAGEWIPDALLTQATKKEVNDESENLYPSRYLSQ